MTTKRVVTRLLIFILLASCVPAIKVVPLETRGATATFVPTPSIVTAEPTQGKPHVQITMLSPTLPSTSMVPSDSDPINDFANTVMASRAGLTMMAAVCPSARPYLIDKFSPGIDIRGPAMLFPDNGEAWIAFGTRLEKNGVVFPKHFWGFIGISVFSFADAVIPEEITIHLVLDTMTMKTGEYDWIPTGKIYRFRSDDEMKWYAACAIQAASR